jgi:hypothetical protein
MSDEERSPIHGDGLLEILLLRTRKQSKVTQFAAKVSRHRPLQGSFSPLEVLLGFWRRCRASIWPPWKETPVLP